MMAVKEETGRDHMMAKTGFITEKRRAEME